MGLWAVTGTRRNPLVMAALMLLLGMSAAEACSSLEPPQTRAQLFARASAVFVAHLLRTEEIKATTPFGDQPLPVVEATFRTIEVFKGRPPADERVRSLVYGPGNCSLPLLSGLDYVFFLYDNDSNFVLLLPGGNEMYFNLEGTSAKETMEDLRKLANQVR